MSNKDVTLKFPISSNGKEISTISMRRPKLRDQLASEKMKGSDAEKEISMIGNLCGLSPDEMEELDLKDYLVLQEVLSGFLSLTAKPAEKPALP